MGEEIEIMRGAAARRHLAMLQAISPLSPLYLPHVSPFPPYLPISPLTWHLAMPQSEARLHESLEKQLVSPAMRDNIRLGVGVGLGLGLGLGLGVGVGVGARGRVRSAPPPRRRCSSSVTGRS